MMLDWKKEWSKEDWGNQRNLIADVKKLSIGKLENKKVTVKFELNKGSYATIVLKKLL